MSRPSGRAAAAQEKAKFEQEIHGQKLKITELQSELDNKEDMLQRREGEIKELRAKLANPESSISSGAGGDRSVLRQEVSKAQWLRELALLELQEQVGRNTMMGVARDAVNEIFTEGCIEIGKQQGDEAATERVRHRINTLTFQIRMTQTVQIKKLREQIAELSHKLTNQEAQAGDSKALKEVRKELSVAEKARLDLAGRLSDSSREMREHRQNAQLALNEAQKWESEAKRIKKQLDEVNKEHVSALAQLKEQQKLQQQQEHERGTAEDKSPRESEVMEHQRQVSELQLLVDDLQSQVAASGQRLAESDRKLKQERERANTASQRASQLESELQVSRSGNAAPESKIAELQRTVENQSDQLGEYRIALNAEKQQRERLASEKEKEIQNLQRNLSKAQQSVANQNSASETEIGQLRNRLADVDRQLKAERTRRESETSNVNVRVQELEQALSKASSTARSDREELVKRNNALETQNSQQQAALSKAEAASYDSERKLVVQQRRATELERDLAVKTEQFSLLSEKAKQTNNQSAQLNRAQMKLDGARHSVAMLVLSQQYQAACIDLFTESAAASAEENRRERENKLVRDLQSKNRDQIQMLELRHQHQLEELKQQYQQEQEQQQRRRRLLGLSDHEEGGNGSSSSSNNTSSGSGGGIGDGDFLSTPPSPTSAASRGGASSPAAAARNLEMRMALERKAFAYLSALDVVAAHSTAITRHYIDSYTLIAGRDADDLSRKIREKVTEHNSAVSSLDSKLQMERSEKNGLQNQLASTQKKFEERVSMLTAEVKESARREKELREKLETNESEHRQMQNKIQGQNQEIQQLTNFSDDLKTSRELERSVLHARIQAAEEAKARSDSSSTSGDGTSGGGGGGSSASELVSALEAANLQIAREHAQVVELEGSVADLKSTLLKERRSRAALEATHREELAVLEQRLGEVRAELAALQLQRDPNFEDDGEGSPTSASGTSPGSSSSSNNNIGSGRLSRPHLQRELKANQEKLQSVNSELLLARDQIRELERKISTERDATIAANDRVEKFEMESDLAKKDVIELRKELDSVRGRHSAETIARESEFDKVRKKYSEKINAMQEEQNSLKLELHTQQMEHMSALHRVERHCLDRIATAEGEAASSNRSTHEELQDRRERVQMLEKKLSSISAQLENRDQLLRTAQEHIDVLQSEQRKSARADEDELSHYRQELKDLSSALVDAKRSQIAAADRSRQVMSNSESELNGLRNEITALRNEIVEMESRHRTELMMKDSNHSNAAKEVRTAKEEAENYKTKFTKLEKEHAAESKETRTRIESLLEKVATEDVMQQLRRAQSQNDSDSRRLKESSEFIEKIRGDNNQLEAEVDRLKVRTKQLEADKEEISFRLKATEQGLDKKVEHAMSNMQQKVEAEAELWEARSASASAENSQLRRLLLEEQRTATEAAQRIVQLEMALDDLEVELVTVKHHNQIQQQQQQNQLISSASSGSPFLSASASSPGTASAASSPTTGATTARRRLLLSQYNENNSSSMSGEDISNVRKKLIEIPSLAQMTQVKQTARLELERLEFERRTEIESDVFEWRWSISAFVNLLQSAFHSFTLQLMRASDHASSMEAEVEQLETDVRQSLFASQRRNVEQDGEIMRLHFQLEHLTERGAIAFSAEYSRVEAARMFLREAVSHGRSQNQSNRQLIAKTASFQQERLDTFLVQRRVLQQHEAASRHGFTSAVAECYGFFSRMFRYSGSAFFANEQRIKSLHRRLEIVISAERTISDSNINVLNRKSTLLQRQNTNVAQELMLQRKPQPHGSIEELTVTNTARCERDESVQRKILYSFFVDSHAKLFQMFGVFCRLKKWQY